MTAYISAQVCVVIGILIFNILFNKSILHQSETLSTVWTKMSSFIFFIAVLFHCKIMQFFLICFHSFGTALKLDFYVTFFQVWPIKQILDLFLFYASAYY